MTTYSHLEFCVAMFDLFGAMPSWSGETDQQTATLVGLASSAHLSDVVRRQFGVGVRVGLLRGLSTFTLTDSPRSLVVRFLSLLSACEIELTSGTTA